MKKYKKVRYADGAEIDIMGYSVSKNIVSLYYPELTENTSGFIIYDEAGNVIHDCSAFKYRWDVLDQKPGRIYYTNKPDCRQTQPWPDLSDITEQAEPLSNEELTEAVADLMYEVSMMQLEI